MLPTPPEEKKPVKRDRRYRPWPIRLLNRSRKLLTGLGRIDSSLTASDYLEAARRQSGLKDYGELDFLPALEKLLVSLGLEAKLNVMGELATRAYIEQILHWRLKLQADRLNHQGITRQEINQPVFIIGLPRTGSTILFELMALDPGFRSPLTWEVMYPTFQADGITRQHLNRLKARFSVALVQMMAPEYRGIHEIGAHLPQECIAIQSLAFQSIQFHTTYNVPSYQSWLENSDWSPAYRIHKAFLQHLQGRQQPLAPPCWLLKAPGHLYSLDELFNTYPDARIIQTHRNPVDVIPSITSLSVTLRQAFSDVIDEKATGHFSAASWHQALTTSLAWRDLHPKKSAQFLDIDYRNFVNDTNGTLAGIYDFLNRPFSDANREAVHAYLNQKPQHKHGAHRYSMEEYGLSLDDEITRYQSYMKRFNLL